MVEKKLIHDTKSFFCQKEKNYKTNLLISLIIESNDI